MRNPIEFREWFKILFRVWRPAMSPNQFLTALFVFDRTAGWGKEWETITHQQFLEGILGAKDGKSYASGLKMSKNTLIDSLSWLKANQVLLQRPNSNRSAYSLNYEWNPEHHQTMSLASPKRLQNLQTHSEKGAKIEPFEGAKIEPFEGAKIEPYKKGKENCFAKDETGNTTYSRRDDEPDLMNLLSDAQERSRTKRKAKVAAWSTSSSLIAWHDLCKSQQPSLQHLATTKTDGVILHRYGKRWIDNGRNPDAWLVYLEWVILRWPGIRNDQFAWMKASSPGVPSIRFFVRFSDRFEQAYADRSKIEHVAGQTTREREVDRLVAKGMDKLVAEKDVDSRLGLTREREALEKAGRELKQQRLAKADDFRVKDEAVQRNAEWTRRRAKSLDETTGDFEPWR
jgi:hypothetical protein